MVLNLCVKEIYCFKGDENFIKMKTFTTSYKNYQRLLADLAMKLMICWFAIYPFLGQAILLSAFGD